MNNKNEKQLNFLIDIFINQLGYVKYSDHLFDNNYGDGQYIVKPKILKFYDGKAIRFVNLNGIRQSEHQITVYCPRLYQDTIHVAEFICKCGDLDKLKQETVDILLSWL